MLEHALEDAWSDFARSLTRRGRSRQTVEIYRKSFEAFWSFAHEHGLPPDPSAVTHQTINAWTSWSLEQPVVRNGRVQTETDPQTGKDRPKLVTPNTVRIRWQNLRPFFSWWSVELEVPNPFDRADVPKLDESLVPVIPMDSIRRVLATCTAEKTEFEDARDSALVRFFADTGCRLGEVATMTRDAWNRQTDTVLVDGKTGPRAVHPSAATAEQLSRYLRLRARHPRADLPAFWLGLRGSLTPSGITQIIYRRCDEAEIPRLHPHAFRHTWGHEMKMAGASESDLMQLGGWTTTAMVHRYGKSAAAARARDTARRISLGDRL